MSMDQGKTYDIWYKDENTVRHKTLIFEKIENNLLYFFNQQRQVREIIPINNTIRIEQKSI